MPFKNEKTKTKRSENNINAENKIQPCNSLNFHEDKQLKLSPLSLIAKLRPNKTTIRTSNLSLEQVESNNIEQKGNCVGEHVSFYRRGSSVSTNERLENVLLCINIYHNQSSSLLNWNCKLHLILHYLMNQLQKTSKMENCMGRGIEKNTYFYINS